MGKYQIIHRLNILRKQDRISQSKLYQAESENHVRFDNNEMDEADGSDSEHSTVTSESQNKKPKNKIDLDDKNDISQQNEAILPEKRKLEEVNRNNNNNNNQKPFQPWSSWEVTTFVKNDEEDGHNGHKRIRHTYDDNHTHSNEITKLLQLESNRSKVIDTEGHWDDNNDNDDDYDGNDEIIDENMIKNRNKIKKQSQIEEQKLLASRQSSELDKALDRGHVRKIKKKQVNVITESNNVFQKYHDKSKIEVNNGNNNKWNNKNDNNSKSNGHHNNIGNHSKKPRFEDKKKFNRPENGFNNKKRKF